MTDRKLVLQRTLDLEVAGLVALRTALDGALGQAVLSVVDLVFHQSGRLIVTGMGKSGHVGRKIAATLSSTGTPSLFLHPAEASHGDLGMIGAEDVVLALSWSGEAPELADIIAYCKRFGRPLIAITARADSALGTAADFPLVLPLMAEACPNGLAPTTSTTMQMAMGDALAMCLLEARGFSAEDFRAVHPGGKLGAQLKRARDLMHGPSELPLVEASASIQQALIVMTSRRFGVAGVLDEAGALVGIMTDGDLRRALQAAQPLDGPVSAVMTKSPQTAPAEMMTADLLRLMNTRSITSLFVVEQQRPIGIIHIHDLLRVGVG